MKIWGPVSMFITNKIVLSTDYADYIPVSGDSIIQTDDYGNDNIMCC
jgi:hypothetical protein